MGFILREPHSATANFLENVGEGWCSATLCVDVSVLGDAPVGEAREVAILNDANPPVRSPELPDNVHRDFHDVVDDVVLADRMYAVNWRVGASVEEQQHFRHDRR